MAEYCVYYTALGGLNRNYTVNYIENAIGTRNVNGLEKIKTKLERKGTKILKH
jgi:nicotinamidase-related amidase